MLMYIYIDKIYRFGPKLEDADEDEDESRSRPMPLPSEWYEDHLVIADQKDSEDEFIVDALYFTKANTLACKAGNKICFETKHIGAMKEHRENLHPFLEQRFSVEIWRDLVPGVFRRQMEETREVLPADSSTRGPNSQVPEDQVSQSATSALEDNSASRKEFGEGADNGRTKSDEDPENKPVIIQGILRKTKPEGRARAPVKVVHFQFADSDTDINPDTDTDLNTTATASDVNTDTNTATNSTDTTSYDKSVETGRRKDDPLRLRRAGTAVGEKKKSNKKMTCSEALRRFGRHSRVRGTKLAVMGPLQVYRKTKTEMINDVVDGEVHFAFNGRYEHYFSLSSQERENQVNLSEKEGSGDKKGRRRRTVKSK